MGSGDALEAPGATSGTSNAGREICSAHDEEQDGLNQRESQETHGQHEQRHRLRRRLRRGLRKGRKIMEDIKDRAADLWSGSESSSSEAESYKDRKAASSKLALAKTKTANNTPKDNKNNNNYDNQSGNANNFGNFAVESGSDSEEEEEGSKGPRRASEVLKHGQASVRDGVFLKTHGNAKEIARIHKPDTNRSHGNDQGKDLDSPPNTNADSNKDDEKEQEAEDIPGFLVQLERAEGLPASDLNGKSDPYVVLRHGRVTKKKSSVRKKTLNPSWDGEELFVPVPENTSIPLVVEVFDKDFFCDDFLGSAEVGFETLYKIKDDTFQDMVITLRRRKHEQEAGKLYMRIKRAFRPREDLNSHNLKNGWIQDTDQRTVVVELVRAHGLVTKRGKDHRDPYVKIRLNKMHRKSRTIYRTLHPKWKQRFEFFLGRDDDTWLHFQIKDRDLFSANEEMGEARIDVRDLPSNSVRNFWLPIYLGGKPAGQLNINLTIFGSHEALTPVPQTTDQEVGMLRLHIVRAKNLKASDLDGKSDPFVEIKLSNTRVRTHVEHDTLTPAWDRMFELPVKDVYAHVDLQVYDYDRMSRPDFLGAVRIPLLEFGPESSFQGQMRWYPLKTRDLLARGQGELMIAAELSYQPWRAAFGLILARERDPMRKKTSFSPRHLINAFNRNEPFILFTLRVLITLNRLISWRGELHHTLIAILMWTIFCLYFRAWMIPLSGLLLIGMYNFMNLDMAQTTVEEGGEVRPGLTDQESSRAALRSAIEDFDLDDDVDSDFEGIEWISRDVLSDSTKKTPSQERVVSDAHLSIPHRFLLRAAPKGADAIVASRSGSTSSGEESGNKFFFPSRQAGQSSDKEDDESFEIHDKNSEQVEVVDADSDNKYNGRRRSSKRSSKSNPLASLASLASAMKRGVHGMQDSLNAALPEGDFAMHKSWSEQARLMFRIGKHVQEILEVTASIFERASNIANFSVPLLTRTVIALLIACTLVLMLFQWNIVALWVGYIRFAEEFYFRFCSNRESYIIPYLRTLEVLMRAPSNVDKAQLRRLEPETNEDEDPPQYSCKLRAVSNDNSYPYDISGSTLKARGSSISRTRVEPDAVLVAAADAKKRDIKATN